MWPVANMDAVRKKEDGLQHKGNVQYLDGSTKSSHLGHAKILLGSTDEICD